MSTLLHIGGQDSAHEQRVMAGLRDGGFEVNSRPVGERAAESVDLVLISPAVDRALQVARNVRAQVPECHIVFLTTPETDPLLRKELALARIGTDWSIAPAHQPDDVLRVVRQAEESLDRRRKLRTTLSRLNNRLAEAATAAPRRALISDHFLASVLNELSDAIVVLDHSGTVVAFNDAAAWTFGEIRRGVSFLRTLPGAAREAIRSEFADMALIDVMEGDEVHRYAVAARDPARAELMERARAFAPVTNRRHPSLIAIERGDTVTRNHVDDTVLRQIAVSDEHYGILLS